MYKKLDSNSCPIIRTAGLISKKWILLIVVVVGNSGSLRYSEMEERLGGITPKSLSDALKRLDGLGLISRRAFREMTRRVEYSLTEDGKELYKATLPLLQWAASRTGDKNCTIIKETLARRSARQPLLS